MNRLAKTLVTDWVSKWQQSKQVEETSEGVSASEWVRMTVPGEWSIMHELYTMNT